MLEDLKQAIAPRQEALQKHAIYELVDNPEALNIFMEHHVWAVWDFMSLAKSLQLKYTTCLIPWTPPPKPNLARFINEIIRDEESDIDHNGKPASHFESYLLSMESVGASTDEIRKFVQELEAGTHWKIALGKSAATQSSTRFVSHTLKTVEKGNAIEVASFFAFGRELVLPKIFSLFLSSLNEADKNNPRWIPLKYYLERHIELDGNEHGEAAESLVIGTAEESLDGWRIAKDAAIEALDERIRLWDSISKSILKSRKNN